MMKSNNTLSSLSLVVMSMLASSLALAAPQSLRLDDLLDESLETLSQIVVSASKREESLIDAPLSASVLTAEQIRHSGATSIPEALRMVPGVIVREQTNGVFDVHLRGLDNLPEGSVTRYAANSLTLVMIDNRLVYNHYVGGTPWQSLPIDLVDVDRIEVVTGAAAALYGPNAVTGVIHILTKNPRATKNKLSASVQGGSADTYLGAADAGFEVGENWVGRISYNGQHRSRHETSYYDYVDGVREANPANLNNAASCLPGTNICDLITDADKRFPDRSMALERNGVNGWVSGELPQGYVVDISAGYLLSRNQEIFNDTSVTPFTTVERENFYVNTQLDLGVWDAHFDYAKGSENTLGPEFFSFDYQTVQMGVDAEYLVNGFTLQPTIDYSWREYSGAVIDQYKASMDEFSVGMRSEYTLGRTRVYGALRGTMYNFSDTLDMSWLMGFTHRSAENFVWRASVGRAYQEPFMAYTYQALRFPDLYGIGNKNLDRVYVDTTELGFRWQLDKSWSVDAVVFNNHAQDLHLLYLNGDSYDVQGRMIPVVQHQNIATEADQTGLTAQLMYQKAAWQASIFMTYQETDLSDQVRLNEFYADVGRYNTDNKNTPKTYGGFTLNYSGLNRWIFDVSGYWLDDSQQINSFGFRSPNNLNNSQVAHKLILNSKVTWAMNNEINLFVNMRNLGNSKRVEFANADEAGALYLIGFEWKH